jgi:hypothetical protein
VQGLLSVAYATQGNKAGCARIQQRAALWNMLAKKKPRDAAGLFRKLSTSASPFRRRRNAIYAASLHCAFTSFDALLR